MSESPSIWFLRSGRKRRGKGVVMDRDETTGCVKVDANWPYTQPVWVTPKEVEAAKKIEQPKLKLR